MVVITDEKSTISLEKAGAVKTRQYYQGIWLNKGFKKWNDYIQKKISSVMKRMDKKRN
jgi:predicted N-acyltransferase